MTALVATAAPAAAADPPPVGPETGVTATLRQLRPYGTLVRLGNFPGGSAVTPDGRFYWTVSAGWSGNDVRIVSVHTRRVVQVLQLPGTSGGVAFDPAHRLACTSRSPSRRRASCSTARTSRA